VLRWDPAAPPGGQGSCRRTRRLPGRRSRTCRWDHLRHVPQEVFQRNRDRHAEALSSCSRDARGGLFPSLSIPRRHLVCMSLGSGSPPKHAKPSHSRPKLQGKIRGEPARSAEAHRRKWPLAGGVEHLWSISRTTESRTSPPKPEGWPSGSSSVAASQLRVAPRYTLPALVSGL
jgi:hypothetical protein